MLLFLIVQCGNRYRVNRLFQNSSIAASMRFSHLSVTLSNGWGAKKCVGKYCTLSLNPNELMLIKLKSEALYFFKFSLLDGLWVLYYFIRYI